MGGREEYKVLSGIPALSLEERLNAMFDIGYQAWKVMRDGGTYTVIFIKM